MNNLVYACTVEVDKDEYDASGFGAKIEPIKTITRELGPGAPYVMRELFNDVSWYRDIVQTPGHFYLKFYTRTEEDAIIFKLRFA